MGWARRPAYGWAVVALCFAIAVFGWGLGFYGIGVHLLQLRARHPWPAAEVAAAGTFYFLCGAVMIALLPDALRRWGARRALTAGIGAMAAATALVPVVAAPWQLYAVYVLMAAGWATMSSTAIAAVLTPYFAERKGAALSMALNGASCGGIVVVPALVTLIGASRALAAIMVALLVPALWLILARRPPAAAPSGPTPALGHTRAALLRQPRLWTVAAPFALALAAQVGFLSHQLSLLAPRLGPEGAALAVSVTTAAAVLGRVSLGLLIDRLDVRTAAAGVFALQAAAQLALAAAGPAAPAPVTYLACATFGLSVGNVTTLPALLVQREFAPAAFTSTLSLSTAAGQVTYAFGPALLAAIHDATGGYRFALLACVVLEALAALAVRLPRSRRQPA
jgi:MFS family permease